MVFLRSLNVLRSLNAVSQDFGRQEPLARSEQPQALRSGHLTSYSPEKSAALPMALFRESASSVGTESTISPDWGVIGSDAMM